MSVRSIYPVAYSCSDQGRSLEARESVVGDLTGLVYVPGETVRVALDWRGDAYGCYTHGGAVGAAGFAGTCNVRSGPDLLQCKLGGWAQQVMGSSGLHAIFPVQQALSKGLGVYMTSALDKQIRHDESLLGLVCD